MSLSSSEVTLDRWFTLTPSLVSNPDADAQALASYTRVGEMFLRSLGPKASRSSSDRLAGAEIHRKCRALRGQFMALHADWLYRILTDGYTTRRQLGELAYSAADRCPGLTPTRGEIAAERSVPQSEKEGREIDQGILFHGFLRSPEVAAHLFDTVLNPTARAVALIEPFRKAGRLDLGCVMIERRGCAAYVTMNRGDCLNAEDDCLVEQMETAVDLTLLDTTVRVGVLRGGVMTHPRYAGRRVFCAGINLRALRAGQISFVEFLLRREFGLLNKITRGLRVDSGLCKSTFSQLTNRFEKPWIGCAEGFAIGGGAQLLLVLDYTIGASDAYFSLPAAQEGIVPGFANFRLTRFLGSRGARQLILGGRRIYANEPDARLIFDEIVAPSEIENSIESNVGRFSSPAVAANRHMLNLAEEPVDAFLRYAAEFALTQAERLYSQDVLEKCMGDQVRRNPVER